MKRLISILFFSLACGFAFVRLVPLAQNVEERRSPNIDRNRPDGPPGGPPSGRGPRGGPPSGVQPPSELVKQFDKNGDKWLNLEERKAALEFIEKENAEGRGRRRPGPRGRNDDQAPPEAGRKLSPADVKSYPDASLYDPTILRAVFLEFEHADWEKELSGFYRTDVEVPATMIVDGKTYPQVGLHFRGASSFFTVGPGRKHSINLSTDFINKDQNLYGYRTLNLLNSHTDPTFLRTVLYLQAARDYIPAPKANYLRVVINGESWGVYVNAQQFNKDFIKDNFGTTEGARWKVPGSPRGRGGLEYLGDDVSAYKQIYDIKSKDKKKSWKALIELCRVLNETPSDNLVKELSPLLDIDGALKFLALEIALINGDGYWIRASDYHLYLDEKGQFHVIPHDANETFREPGGPGGRGEGSGLELDPLRGADDPSRPLLHRLLAVPSLRTKYLGYMADIAEKWLDWKKIQPLAEQYQALIDAEVQSDTRKLYSYDVFSKAVQQETETQGSRGPERNMSLKSFVEQRQKFLLEHPAIKAARN